MRWEQLFADLQAQSDALDVAQRAGEVEELARAQFAGIRLIDRIRPSVGTVLTLRCVGGARIVGSVTRVGPDWVLLDEGQQHESIVSVAQITALTGLSRLSTAPSTVSAIDLRLTMVSAIRAIARDRSPVRVHLVDATTVEGTIDRVGANFVEVAAHAVGELRRRSEVREVNLIPTAALSVVRRQM